MRQIRKAAEIEPAKALSTPFVWHSAHQSSLKLPPFFRSFAVKIALRELSRRRSMTIHLAVSLSLIMTLVTLIVIGGLVANETTLSYVERAIGRNVILIAQTEIAQQYENRLEIFLGNSQTDQMGQVNYVDEKYAIPKYIISNLTAVDGVVKIDPSLVLESNVYEYTYVSPDPEDPQNYIVIGAHRNGKALIIGVHPENLVNNWLIAGRNLSEAEQDTALIGDSLSLTLFQEPLKQTFKALDAKFKIAGICLDPLNNGLVVYTPFNRLSAITKHADYNVLLLQIDSYSSAEYSKILNEIETIISEKGLILLELNEPLEPQKAFFESALVSDAFSFLILFYERHSAAHRIFDNINIKPTEGLQYNASFRSQT
ncbi:MAG: hypothetical protein QXX08_08145 [Candidatus Bathyarchaeia archaeon]